MTSLFLTLISFTSSTQVTNISIDEEEYLKENFYGEIVLKDSLSDGEWNVFETIKRRFLTKKLVLRHPLISGNYLNGKKTGRFYYYSNYNTRNRYGIIKIENYENGVLNGCYEEYSPWHNAQLMVKGQYINGKRDGFWLFWKDYYIEGKLKYFVSSIKKYSKSELIEEYYYPSPCGNG